MTRHIAAGVIAWLLISAAWICAAYLLITKEES
jgi:hypothetical protein